MNDFNTVKGPNRFMLMDFLVISVVFLQLSLLCMYLVIYFVCVIDYQVPNGNAILIILYNDNYALIGCAST